VSHSDYDQQYWRPEPPRSGPRGGCLYTVVVAILFTGAVLALALFMLVTATEQGHGAELTFSPRAPRHAPLQESLQLDRFGTYSDEYYARRWKRMCDGPERYDAMREADSRGKSNPCG
jgi:hypothetical protein